MEKYNLYFSDFFDIKESELIKYGAMNISLINDLPLFIDPFLLFNSPKKEYQELHGNILTYLQFLRDEADCEVNSDYHIFKGKLKAWYTFSEVKQTWLGFSLSGNDGKGLGSDFALELHNNLNNIFNDFGSEKVTESSHLEKLCIIGRKVGRDKISDFTTNLVKDYLLSYTEKFAYSKIRKDLCKTVHVKRAYFNYGTKSWASKQYYLPFFNGDYVILTPKDMLTRHDTFINRADMAHNYENIIYSIDDDALRFNLNSYLSEVLYVPNRERDKKPTKKEREEAFLKTVKAYPEIVDYYIRYKERTGEEAVSNSTLAVSETEILFFNQATQFIDKLNSFTNFYRTGKNSYQEALQRVEFLKHVIENQDGYRIFYVNGRPLKREKDLQILFKLLWYASPYNVDSEVNNGRGPVDFKVSLGSKDSTLVEFKLASNSKLKQNLKNQVEIYKKANATKNSIKVIAYFSDEEYNNVQAVLRTLKLDKDKSIILIDARDNKISASQVK